MQNQETYYARAFELAANARGLSSPNPNVGAVLVKDGRIIGEGCTQVCGQDHAEVQALKHADTDPHGAELYVTLEPCCHYGKTPPCTNAIIAAGIRAVHIGILDPNPKVGGKGVAALQAAGIEVMVGFWKEKIERQLEAYLTWITKKRPFVILKTASSLDGCIAATDGSSQWITGEPARQDVHRLRHMADAVVTGIGTVLKDDPQLNCRLDGAVRQPVRVVLDRELQLPENSCLAQTAQHQPTLVFHASDNAARQDALRTLGVELVQVPATEAGVALDAVLAELYRRGLQTVMVEAGSTLAGAFLRERRVDQWIAYYGGLVLGGGKPLFAGLDIPNLGAALHWNIADVERIGDDVRIVAYARYEKLRLRSSTEAFFILGTPLHP